jgi:hypothetical protein
MLCEKGMKMADIYEQHRAAFKDVAAFIVLKNGERVATVALKYPRDGAGRLWAYVHWYSTEMVRGFAAGGGYDKASAACANAARKMTGDSRFRLYDPEAFAAFRDALRDDSGFHWQRCLERVGFTVLEAV